MGPEEKLSYAAHDMNTATRFGRMDIAASHVVGHAREDFLARHREWGRDLRIVDVELSGLRMVTPETAAVSLAVSWHRLSSMEMHTTFVSQKWTSTPDGWKLTMEARANGAPGLFAAPPEKKTVKKNAPDASSGQL